MTGALAPFSYLVIYNYCCNVTSAAQKVRSSVINETLNNVLFHYLFVQFCPRDAKIFQQVETSYSNSIFTWIEYYANMGETKYLHDVTTYLVV
jgi:hypothetical protein